MFDDLMKISVTRGDLDVVNQIGSISDKEISNIFGAIFDDDFGQLELGLDKE